MSKATTGLMNDHDAILSALDLFTTILDTYSNEHIVDPEDLFDFLEFLSEFADKCHHGKEERLLFPAMIAAGVPDRGGPIGVMMAEHIQGRGYIHTMLESLEEPEDLSRFEKAGRAYIELLRMHIQKENNVLFPMADKAISPEILESMNSAFEEYITKVIAQSRLAELQTQLKALKLKYLH